jgi:hypothetical protein
LTRHVFRPLPRAGRGFLDWTSEQWDAFFEEGPESEQLGNASYIGLVEDAIVHNLEGGRPGSRYPLLMGRSTDEVVGWYAHEIAALGDEVRSVREGLAALPINRATLTFDSDDEVRQLVGRFTAGEPARPLSNLYDLCHYYIDAFEQMIEKARTSGGGLWLSF